MPACAATKTDHLAQPFARWRIGLAPAASVQLSRPATLASLLTGLVMLTTLPGCGGADPSNSTGQAVAGDARRQSQGLASAGTVSALDAVRLANQASMGPSEALLAEIQAAGTPAAWIKAQMKLDVSRYRSGGTEAVHKNVDELGYCGQPSQVGNVHCWRDNFSTEPLAWDFYRNATTQPDQLRQRVALALHQFLVVSGHEIGGTYGLRNYQNNFLSLAFGNYRDVLRKVILSPVMGDYLDHVNNDKAAPNENFARELLQLFSLGNCQLNRSATLVGGKCAAVYDNAMVRNYAYALTGWTYPKGGSASWGCWPEGAHCQYYAGDMVPAPKLRNKKPRTLLSGVAVADGADSATALDAVLNSLMAHANLAPFVARQLVQQLVSSNPSPEYVKRVATAFEAGKFKFGPEGSTVSFGTGVKGDLAATVAAALLDPEARDPALAGAGSGRLRSPVLLFTGALRALNGVSDGAPFSWLGGQLRQQIFNPPSVFSYYPSSYPVAGTAKLVGPEFGIHNANGALNRLNFLTYLLDWNGSTPDPSIPGATGTKVVLDSFLAGAGDHVALVDRLSLLMIGKPLADLPREKVISAVKWWTKDRDPQNWKLQRIRTAAYLVMASPDYQVPQ